MNVERVIVVGAGTMGAGIAQVAATYGCAVRLVDVNGEVLGRAVGEIRTHLDRSVAKGRISTDQGDAVFNRISTSSELASLGDVQLAVEAVIENLDVKTEVFQSLERETPAGAVLATNTSSLRVTSIAEAVSNPGRVVGMHFFNPAPLMPLVEIIAADQSDARSLDVVTAAAKAWGKVPVRAKDTPGFIVNRVARGFYLEALRMLGEGVATVDTIDRAMRTLGKFRMGPFQLMDLVGLDVNYAVSCSVWEQSGRPARLKPHDLQRELVEQGRLGRKARRGFYRYESDPPVVNVATTVRRLDLPASLHEAVAAFVQRAALCDEGTREAASPVERYAFGRILAAVMNEAGMALDDEVATAADIDTAMQYGTNYPKGPWAWAGATSRERVVALLNTLNAAVDDGRFAPAESLRH